MLLPLSDAPNPRGIPIVTYCLIAANVAVYALVSLPLGFAPVDPAHPLLRDYLMMVRDSLPAGVSLRDAISSISAYDLFIFAHGYKPAAPALADLFASLFLHGGLLHLAGNMLFLWIYGDNVEHRLGRLPFLVWYLATGVAATLTFSAFARGSMVPMVGASGAISGVLGFYFLWFPRNTVRMFVFLFPIFMNVVTIPARIVLGIYLVVDNLLPFLLSPEGGGGVAHGAHIGGFVAGLGVAWVMGRRELTATPASYRRAEAVDAGGAAEADTAATIAAAIRRGEMATAARAYFAIDSAGARRLLAPEDSLALGGWLAEHQHSDAALVIFRRHLRDFPTDRTAARAHLGAGLVQLTQPGQMAPAYQHFLDALDLDPDPDTAEQARAALALIASRQKYQLGRPGK
jgi:membrane associated rhomboid family serine protease